LEDIAMDIAATIATTTAFGRPASIAHALVRAYFTLVSSLMPDLARRHAERLFTQPPNYSGEDALAFGARRDTVVVGRHAIAVWQAGASTAPAVVLVHGWGGRGAQMASFVGPLLVLGYRVVWFDQPGHGESGRGSVGLPDFATALEALAVTHGPFDAAIGHSLGAAAIGLAVRHGTRVGHVACVGAPASLREHTMNFAHLIGLPVSIREAMRRRLERRFGFRFTDIDWIDKLDELHVPTLFVHDRNDRHVTFEHALRLSNSVRGARLITTYGFGHLRLLREPSVVYAVVDFITGRNRDVPSELPVLPRPAPLY
jgi:pimeloyl-ACP methyl ester carboxylesterase